MCVRARYEKFLQECKDDKFVKSPFVCSLLVRKSLNVGSI
jgi:hypothetical protein